MADPRRNLFRWARYRAQKSGIPFSISPEDIVVPTHCPVFGALLEAGHPDYAPSLDRLVPHRGYTKDNIVVISRRANKLKNDGLPWELRQVADFVETQILKETTP